MVAEGRTLDTIYESAAGPVTPMDLIFGHHACVSQSEWNGHRTGFTAQTLGHLLRRAGFKGQLKRGQAELWAVVRKGIPDQRAA